VVSLCGHCGCDLMPLPHFQTLLRRLRRKPTLRLGAGSSIAPGARILNAGPSSDCIQIGEHCRIEGELFVFAHGGQITLGDWCFVGPGTRLWSARQVTIGHRVLISHNCNVMDSLTHPLDARERHRQFKTILTKGHPALLDLDERPVCIEDDAWLGAGAVVTHDVPPFGVVVGNPARLVRLLNAGIDR
jgi:acetyltransferase-like isoleucine patch superfamily enzyme